MILIIRLSREAEIRCNFLEKNKLNIYFILKLGP